MAAAQKIPLKELKKIKKILIIQYKPFGDILLNTGYFPALRNKFPDAQIDYLIQKPYKTLLEENSCIDNLLLMKKKKKNGLNYIPYLMERLRVMWLVRRRKYDVIIDQLRGTGSAQITMTSGAKYKLGWKLKRWNWVYNYAVPRDNIRYYSRLKFDVLAPLGIDEVEHNIYYKVKDESKSKISNWLEEKGLKDKNFVVFSPGTPVIYKQWSLDYYAVLADKIQTENKLPVVLLWGPGEKEDVNYIISKMKTEPILALPTIFNEAAALLQKAKIFVGNDGGINHVSISQRTPSLAIFGPHSNPKKWQAWHKKEHLYIRNYDCTDRNDRTLCLSSEKVYEKFQELKANIEK